MYNEAARIENGPAWDGRLDRAGTHVVALASQRQIRGLALSTVEQVLAQAPPDWLIHGVLPEKGLAVVYGESQSGKTFLALDAVGAVVTGRQWFGKEVTAGAVIYVAAEGRLRNRLDAYMRRHGLSAGDLSGLRILEKAIDLSNPSTEDVHGLVDAITILKMELEAEGRSIALVVLDTVARVMQGSDENSGKDMGSFIAATQKIQDASGGLVLAVHHCGKDTSRGARGHSSLRAATEAELEVTRDQSSGVRTVRVAKVRDGEDGEMFSFRLEPIELDYEQKSCAVIECETAQKQKSSRRLNPNEQIGLDAFKEELSHSGRELPGTSVIPAGVKSINVNNWRSRFHSRLGETEKTGDAKKMAWNRAKSGLIGKHVVQAWEDFVWLVDGR